MWSYLDSSGMYFLGGFFSAPKVMIPSDSISPLKKLLFAKDIPFSGSDSLITKTNGIC